jgi:hypothetical protein
LLWRLLANSEWDESENAVIDLWCGVIKDLDNGRDAVLTKASLVEIKRLCYSFGNGGCLNSPCATNTFAVAAVAVFAAVVGGPALEVAVSAAYYVGLLQVNVYVAAVDGPASEVVALPVCSSYCGEEFGCEPFLLMEEEGAETWVRC